MNISSPLDLTFAALADPTRRAILARLAHGEATVGELAEPFAMSQPAISKHLKVLEQAGLVSASIAAQRRPRRLETAPLQAAVTWLEDCRRLWASRFQQLDGLLSELTALQSHDRAQTRAPSAAGPEQSPDGSRRSHRIPR